MLYLNDGSDVGCMIIPAFNFNKCCIWIVRKLGSFENILDLTLTNVVFEST